MKEFDLESYNRKFLHTLTVFEDNSYGYIRNIEYDGETFSFLTNKKIIKKNPLYFNFQSRIYNTNSGGYVALIRRIKKTWKVGLCEQTHNMISYLINDALENLKPLDPLKYNINQSLEDQGPISNKLYITKREVLFLDREVGIRYKNNFLVNKAIEQEIKDALMGLECKIST